MRRWIGIRTDGQLRELMAQAASVRNVGHSVVTFSPKVPTHTLGKIDCAIPIHLPFDG